MTASGKKSAEAPTFVEWTHEARLGTFGPMAIGTFGADNGLHSLVVSPVGAIQNQHSSSPTKDRKPLRNEDDEREETRGTRHVLAGYKNRPRHTFTSWHHWGSPAFGRCPFLPSLFPNLHLRYLNMSGASFFTGAHHFVASDNTFSEAKTVSGIMSTKGIRQQTDGFGSVADQHPQPLWQ